MKKYVIEMSLDEEDDALIMRGAKATGMTPERYLRCLLGVSIAEERQIFGEQTTERKE